MTEKERGKEERKRMGGKKERSKTDGVRSSRLKLKDMELKVHNFSIATQISHISF